MLILYVFAYICVFSNIYLLFLFLYENKEARNALLITEFRRFCKKMCL